jgi:hypothetical protein
MDYIRPYYTKVKLGTPPAEHLLVKKGELLKMFYQILVFNCTVIGAFLSAKLKFGITEKMMS